MLAKRLSALPPHVFKCSQYACIADTIKPLTVARHGYCLVPATEMALDQVRQTLWRWRRCPPRQPFDSIPSRFLYVVPQALLDVGRNANLDALVVKVNRVHNMVTLENFCHFIRASNQRGERPAPPCALSSAIFLSARAISFAAASAPLETSPASQREMRDWFTPMASAISACDMVCRSTFKES